MANVPAKLLIATHNKGKLKELGDMLTEIPIILSSLADFPEVTEVAETGSTFNENARLKAAEYAIRTGMTAIADDSGLEVAALEGRPGVHSARYGGPDTDFSTKMALLLTELANIPGGDRKARFVCSIAVADAAGRILHQTEGICTGTIASQPRGDLGFGYDPIFVPDGYQKTFGELPASVKREISHRSRAFRVIIPFLRHFSAN